MDVAYSAFVFNAPRGKKKVDAKLRRHARLARTADREETVNACEHSVIKGSAVYGQRRNEILLIVEQQQQAELMGLR